MGFFSDLKEDLAVAVNELMPVDGEETTADTAADAVQETAEEAVPAAGTVKAEPEKDLQWDDMLEKLDSMDTTEYLDEEPEEALQEEEEALADEPEPGPGETAAEETEELPVEEVQAEPVQEDGIKEQDTIVSEDDILDALSQNKEKIQEEGAKKAMDNMTNRTVSDETAVITQGMAVTGDIISEGSIDVIGTINGNIDILGKLNITGTITGNSKASEIFADGAKINGEISCDGSVKIGQSSVIIGNITATSAVIAGAVKGDIDVKGPVILDTSAIVMGNIKSKSVQINNGAVIEGMCSQCYAEINPTSFFEDLKA